MTAMTLALVNQPSDEALANRVEVAVTRRARRKAARAIRSRAGECADHRALRSIHTMFMRFDIDVVFVDEDGRAVKVVRGMTPWRIAVDPTAHAVVELPAGSLRDGQVNVGDRLYLLEPGGKRVGLFVDDLREIHRAEPPLAA